MRQDGWLLHCAHNQLNVDSRFLNGSGYYNLVIWLYGFSNRNKFTGYGKVEEGLFNAFCQSGVEVLANLDCGNHPYMQLHPFGNEDDIHLIIGSPDVINMKNSQLRKPWLYSMCETDMLSKHWADQINAHFELVLVPNDALVNSFYKGGVRVPIHDVSFGLDKCQYIERDPEPDIFTWLTYSVGGIRKGADVAVFAFDRLFKGDSRHRMVVHVSNEGRHAFSGVEHPQIEFVTGIVSPEEQLERLREASVFLFPSRGEGIGLPPREAALTGLPTIATRWLSMSDIDGWGWGIDAELQPNQYSSLMSKDGCWVSNDLEQAMWGNPVEKSLDRRMLDMANPHIYQVALNVNRDVHIPYLEKHTWGNVVSSILKLKEAYHGCAS